MYILYTQYTERQRHWKYTALLYLLLIFIIWIYNIVTAVGWLVAERMYAMHIFSYICFFSSTLWNTNQILFAYTRFIRYLRIYYIRMCWILDGRHNVGCFILFVVVVIPHISQWTQLAYTNQTIWIFMRLLCCRFHATTHIHFFFLFC